MPARAPNKNSVKKTGTAFPIFESIGSAASQIGCPEALIKTAKRAGCRAFISGGRVDASVLVPFLFSMLSKGSEIPDGFTSWREVLESEKAKREAIKRQIDEKSMMPTDDARRQAAEAMGMTFSELERRDRELPPALAGLSAIEIFKRMKADTESVRRNLKAKFDEVGK